MPSPKAKENKNKTKKKRHNFAIDPSPVAYFFLFLAGHDVCGSHTHTPLAFSLPNHLFFFFSDKLVGNTQRKPRPTIQFPFLILNPPPPIFGTCYKVIDHRMEGVPTLALPSVGELFFFFLILFLYGIIFVDWRSTINY